MDTLPFFRRTLEDAGLEDLVVAVVGDSHHGRRALAHARCRCCSSTAGTARSTPRTTTPAGRRWLMPGGLLAIHDVFPDPADGGRPPYHVFLRALASGALRRRSRRSARCGCCGGRAGTAGDPVG